MIKTNGSVPHRRRRIRVPAVETVYNRNTRQMESRNVTLVFQRSYSPESARAEIEAMCNLQRNNRKEAAS
jgi:hypothetical protein